MVNLQLKMDISVPLYTKFVVMGRCLEDNADFLRVRDPTRYRFCLVFFLHCFHCNSICA